jgi:hypothetical protein
MSPSRILGSPDLTPSALAGASTELVSDKYLPTSDFQRSANPQVTRDIASLPDNATAIAALTLLCDATAGLTSSDLFDFTIRFNDRDTQAIERTKDFRYSILVSTTDSFAISSILSLSSSFASSKFVAMTNVLPDTHSMATTANQLTKALSATRDIRLSRRLLRTSQFSTTLFERSNSVKSSVCLMNTPDFQTSNTHPVSGLSTSNPLSESSPSATNDFSTFTSSQFDAERNIFGGLSMPMIIGAAIGLIVVCAILIGLYVFVRRRGQKYTYTGESGELPTQSELPDGITFREMPAETYVSNLSFMGCETNDLVVTADTGDDSRLNNGVEWVA